MQFGGIHIEIGDGVDDIMLSYTLTIVEDDGFSMGSVV